MKLEIARSVFLLAALGVATAAAAAWDEPHARIVSADGGQGSAAPRMAKANPTAKPDRDVLLFMYSLVQGSRTKG
ncbi:hypothetical protein SFA35_21475 [Pseudomonas sp. HR96]|uniref:hypothetical protein n=1 Tax=Pseudomonas sp. HR96 TaxID=1027966 RepID=UPI002A75D2CC|nr:hypothetical protein [Pseudomonas sp. HR96]WPO99151.1 hypothetical protein SFA35_21475 [Pseudomonas sp. HR96]